MARSLVVPLDGSKLAESVLPWATALSAGTYASLLLVRVTMNRPHSVSYLTEGVQKHHMRPEWREAEEYLNQLKRRLEKAGLEVHTRIRNGVVADTVLDVADDENAAAIALTTHGRHGTARFFLGSVATALVHQARIPVFVVPTEAGRRGRPPSVQRVLVPLDGSALAEQALEYVSDIAGPDTTLVLLRVVSPEDVEAVTPNVLVPSAGGQHRADGAAREYLNEVAHRLHGLGRKAQIMTAHGHPAQEIIRAATEAQADAVVMTTHARSGPARWRLGSVADEVIRQGDVPVLLVSPRMTAARSATTLRVLDIMDQDPDSLATADTVAVALRKMVRRRVGASPVVDDEGNLVGMLSQHDLGSSAGRGPTAFADWARATTVGASLKEETVSIVDDAPLDVAMQAFFDAHLDVIPVVRGDRLVGVITLQDVLAAVIDERFAADDNVVPA